MNAAIKPLKAQSLSDSFVKSMERLILSGRLAIGERLPSERELAQIMNVSRPVVHEGLVELARLGLVKQKPRVGAVVNDYRRDGSVALLNTLLEYTSAEIEPNLLASLLDMRELLEVEIARLAARNRRGEHLQALARLVQEESARTNASPWELAETDFTFHHQLALAGGNIVYPLLLNSFRPVIANLSSIFYARQRVVRDVFRFHSELLEAINKKDAEAASLVMRKLIRHGRRHLYKSFPVVNEKRREEET